MFSRKKLQHIFKIFIVFLNLFFAFQNKLIAQNSSAYNNVRVSNGADPYCADFDLATSNQKSRATGCFSSKYNFVEEKCEIPDLKFDPFGNNIDLDWNYGNDFCLAYIVGAGVTMETAFIGCRVLCPGPPASIGKKALEKLTQGGPKMQKLKKVANVAKQASGATNLVAAGVMGGMPLDPFTVMELGIFAARCAGILESTNCCSALATCGIASSVAVGIVGGIYETAKDVFANVHICGRGWKSFVNPVDSSNNPIKENLPNQYKSVDGNYKQCLNVIFGRATYNPIPFQNCTNIKTKAQNQFCNLTGDNTCQIKSNLTNSGQPQYPGSSNVHYREYLYKGIEYADNGSNPCKNPKDEPGKNDWEKLLGYNTSEDAHQNQKYYLRGPRELPNFACKRFLQLGRKNTEGMKAYLCCNEKSQNTLCLETQSKYHFCRIGEGCSVEFERNKAIPSKYKIFESEANPNYICAKTYSSCPYDHNVQGGTDYDERFALNPRVVSNFCQYMNHCIKRPPIAKYSNFDPETFFFAESCDDLRGDSQFMSLDDALRSTSFSSNTPRHFSAPIVQCFKETLENNFMQKVGRSACNDITEEPKLKYLNGKKIETCESGFSFRKGDKKDQTFFNKIQNQFRFPLKIAFVLSVVFFGFNILLATPESFINKKTVMTYLVKFGLVYFFVLGSAWQSFFMDSVMNLSTEFSNITFRPQQRNDGCNFPKYNQEKLNSDKDDITAKEAIDTFKIEVQTNPHYPIGKGYLRVFDTLDCKIARALGYGPDVSTPNLAKMIFSGLLTGGLGITFFFAAFAYGFMLISIAMRAIHITIISIMGIILLIYVSPITITCALFERTKGIFENWWKQMLGFILQPMIVFAYIGLMLTVFDNLFIGDATFEANPPSSQLFPKLSCEKQANSLINPEETSVYCILNFSKYRNFSGLEVFDLAIPILGDLNSTKINTLFRAAIVMFVFFNFFDKITTVAKKLVGGADLSSDSGLSQLKNQIQKAARGVQKRAANTVMRGAIKQVPNSVKDRIRGTALRDTPPPKPKNSSKAPDTVSGGEGGGGDKGGG
jgi:hypothetical protein